MYNTKRQVIKLRILALIMCLIMALSYTAVITYAANDTDKPVGWNPSLTETPGEKADGDTEHVDLEGSAQSDVETFIGNYFGSDIFSNANLGAGYQIATPFAGLILTLTLALVVILMYAFFGQTAIDLMYLTVPATRSFFNNRKEQSGGFGASSSSNKKGSFFQISDSAVEAVGGGSSGGGLSGSSERGVGSSLLKYFSLRTAEMITFVLFIIFVFTGMIGKVIIVIFRLFMSLFEGFLNMA